MMAEINIKKLLLFAFGAVLPITMLIAQGPPILTDKPILLGEKKGTFRTFFLYRKNDNFTLNVVPVMLDYNVRKNLEISMMAPLVIQSDLIESPMLGDISAGIKYQFYQSDGLGRTFRAAAKLRQTLPTGKQTIAPEVGMQQWQTYLGILGGIESLKYGIQSEVGYMLSNETNSHMHKMLMFKLGFGLPLLKPSYPVKQITLYFEYEGLAVTRYDHFAVFYAQGLQYAYKKWTFDLSLQWPLRQSLPIGLQRDFSALAGFRFVI